MNKIESEVALNRLIAVALTIFGLFVLPVYAQSGMSRYLYRIEYRGQVSWLLGTLHLDALRLEGAPEIRAALSQSTRLVVEWKPGARPTPPGGAENHFLPGNQSVTDSMNPDQARKLRIYFRTAFQKYWSVPAHQVEIVVERVLRLKPGVVFKIWGEFLERDEQELASREGLVQTQSEPLDLQIFNFAQARGIAISGFRDPDYLLNEFFLKQVSSQDLAEGIDKALGPNGQISRRRVAAYIEHLRNVGGVAPAVTAELYRSGAPPSLIHAAIDQMKQVSKDTSDLNGPMQEVFDATLSRAHQYWLDDLFKYVQQGGVFMAVGLSHVDRDASSMLNQLRRRFGNEIKISNEHETSCEDYLSSNPKSLPQGLEPPN